MQVEPPAAEEFNTGSFANRKTFYSFKANFLCRLSANHHPIDVRQTHTDDIGILLSREAAN